MADLTITATQVLPGAGARYADGTAGAAIVAGQAVYNSTSDTMLLADADAGTPAAANVRGISLNAASIGQPVRIQTEGIIMLGAAAAPVKGTIYVLSGTAGGIAPSTDLAAADRVTVIGVGGTTAGTLVMPTGGPFSSNVVV